jgi:hypothetical protein
MAARAGADWETTMSTPITLTRRSLLRTGAIATATLVGLRPWAPASAAAAPSHLVRSSYAGLEGQRFAAGPVGLRLLSVADVAGAALDRSLRGSEDAFVLTFSGPLDAPLAAGTHDLSNDRLGTFELFLSPVEQPRGDRRYEAVVDRSVGSPKSPPTGSRAPEPAAESETPTATAPGASRASARLFRRVALRRTARGARAEVVLRRAAGAARVEGRLMRRGKTIAVAARSVRDHRAVLRFRGAPELPAGNYTLLLTVVDAAGASATRRRRVTLR